MLKIALIDDKSYWIEKIKRIHKWTEFSLDYFETFKSFNSTEQYYDIIYLDYYLDIDRITWDTVLSKVKKRAKKVIWFSSVENCNKILEKSWADWSVLKQ